MNTEMSQWNVGVEPRKGTGQPEVVRGGCPLPCRYAGELVESKLYGVHWRSIAVSDQLTSRWHSWRERETQSSMATPAK